MLLNVLIPTSGEILYSGKPLLAYKQEYYEKIASVLEGDRNIYWYLTGYQNIRYFARLKGISEAEIKERDDQLLKLFDLYEDRDKQAGNYSRGMLQKLSIIIGLVWLVLCNCLFLGHGCWVFSLLHHMVKKNELMHKY